MNKKLLIGILAVIVLIILTVGVISLFKQQGSGELITLKAKDFQNNEVRLYFTSHVDLSLENLRVIKNGKIIDVQNLRVGRLDTVVRISEESRNTIYSSHPYELRFEDVTGVTSGDVYILEWGNNINLTITMNPPLIEITNASYQDSSVIVTYYNKGGGAEILAEAPIIKTKEGKEVDCFYMSSVNAAAFNIENGESRTISFKYCRENISIENIKEIRVCTMLSTRTERNCKTFEYNT